MDRNDGGPAFPRNHVHEGGMALRDYFAAKAMQALINPNGEPLDRLDEVPEYAYQIADAMLAERAKERT